jgi:hypothetical protein
MRRWIVAILAASALVACGETGSNGLTEAERSRVEELASGLATSLGDPSPDSGLAVTARRREADELFWPGTAVEEGDIVVVVMRGDFAPYSSPPSVDGEPAGQPESFPVLIVLYDRATFEQLDVGERLEMPTDAELASLGKPTGLFR